MRAFILALAAVLSLTSVSSAQTVKIGYVKVDMLLSRFSDFTNAQAALKKEAEAWQTEMENYQKQLSALQDNYRQKSTLVSPEKQREMQTEIMKKTQEAQNFQQSILGPEGKAEKRKNEMMGPINEKVNKAINLVGERDKYTIILSDETLLFANSTTDVTEEVLKVLSAGLPAAPPAATKPAIKPGAGPVAPRK